MKTLITALLLTAWVHSAIPSGDSVTNSVGMKFKRIPAGSFQMGYEGGVLPASYASYQSSLAYAGKGIYNEYPRHTVVLTRDFYIGRYEVTNQQFFQFNPAHCIDNMWYENGANYPVHRVSWYAADSFCRWLTQNDPNGWTYRLPTEAEWEYCCRAGTTTRFHTGDTISPTEAAVANDWPANVPFRTIGNYPPNPWGLYDMHGNADEWCLDWYAPYTAGPDTNPGGLIDAGTRGGAKSERGNGKYYLWARCATRGSIPPVDTIDGTIGFRVVISDLTQDSLRYQPVPDTLPPYLKRVAASRPSPATDVRGESYTDAEGIAFKRVRMARTFYPSQRDSVVYVSQNPIGNDSGVSRALAGAYARRLSGTHGVLYRLSNRYELHNAGIPADAGYHLTILPDIRYDAGRPHPDVTYYVWRETAKVPVEDSIGGPLWYKCNHVAAMAECPNGDLIATWYSTIGEDVIEQNIAASRLRLGEDAWDAQTSLASDFAAFTDNMMTFWNNGKGRLFRQTASGKTAFATFQDYSDDNGLTWSPYVQLWNGLRAYHYVPLAGDTVVTLSGRGDNRLKISLDGCQTWSSTGTTVDANHYVLMALDDNRLFNLVTRSSIKNSDSVLTMYSCHSSDKGQTWIPSATPFKPAGSGFHGAALKLHSGRLVVVTFEGSGVGSIPGRIIVESEDQGRTWFCRRKLGTTKGVNYMGGYMYMLQGQDGIIHLLGTNGSGTGNGDNPQISFSEQWLREGSCLDIAEWGITTAGMAAAGCPGNDSMPPLTLAVKAMPPAVSQTLSLRTQPNPFNSLTAFQVGFNGNRAAITIYDIRGKAVQHLDVSAKGKTTTLIWNGRDNNGAKLPAGLYLAKLSADNGQNLSRRLFLVK